MKVHAPQRAFALVLVLSFLLSAGCARTETGQGGTDSSAAVSGTSATDEGVIPFIPRFGFPKDAVTEDVLFSGMEDVSFDTAAEVADALRAGEIDAAYLPGMWYLLCEDIVTPLMARPVRTLLLAGPSADGQALFAKARGETALTFDDFAKVRWCVLSASSDISAQTADSWLNDSFGEGMDALPSVSYADSYLEAFLLLAKEETDLIVIRDDVREDFANRWESAQYPEDMGREQSVYEETGIVVRTSAVYLDMIVVRKESDWDPDEAREKLSAFFNEHGGWNSESPMLRISFDSISESDLDFTLRVCDALRERKAAP